MREAREEDEEAQKKEERKKLEASDVDNKPKEDAKDEKANS